MGTALAVPNTLPPVKVLSLNDTANNLASVDFDLAGVSGFPDFGPQEVIAHASSADTVRFLLLDTTTIDVVLAAGETRQVQGPIVGVVAAGTGANVTLLCYWRHTGRFTANP